MGRDTKPQLFTPALRDYLTGGEVSNEADARSRIKNRIRYTFGDFNLLRFVEPELREEIFEFRPAEEGLEPMELDPEPSGYVKRGDYEKAGSKAELTAGTFQLLKFLYQGYRSQGRREEFLGLFKVAIKHAEAELNDTTADNVDVEVNASVNVDTDYSVSD